MSSALELPIVETPKAGGRARFHISLNARDLTRTVEFFRVFLGREPAKCRPDYAKFELDDPPLVLSLEPHAANGGGNLNHLGFRMPDSAALVEVQRRLEQAGISTIREEGVECCYSRQTKFWVHDPDGNMWEVYTLDEDIDHRGAGQAPSAVLPPTAQAKGGPPPAVWNHRLGQLFGAKLPILDGTVDAVSLQGTLNERKPAEVVVQRMREVFRVLKPGGTVHLHMLTSDRPVGDAPISLPGPAAAVEHVPTETEVLELLSSVGLVDVKTSFRGASPCFRIGEAELRETRFEARKA